MTNHYSSEHLKPFGIVCDDKLNNENGKLSNGRISDKNSKVKVGVIKTNEELMIAKQVSKLFS